MSDTTIRAVCKSSCTKHDPFQTQSYRPKLCICSAIGLFEVHPLLLLLSFWVCSHPSLRPDGMCLWDCMPVDVGITPDLLAVMKRPASLLFHSQGLCHCWTISIMHGCLVSVEAAGNIDTWHQPLRPFSFRVSTNGYYHNWLFCRYFFFKIKSCIIYIFQHSRFMH